MDPNFTTTNNNNNNSDKNPEEENPITTNQNVAPQIIIPASISLSLSSLIPSTSHFLLPPPSIPKSNTNPPPKIKIPSQISSLSLTSSLSSKTPKPSSFSKPSSISSKPLQSLHPLNPLRPNHPSSAFPLRRASVVFLRNDLRLHDNECLSSANSDSLSVLPVYCFDPRDYGKSSTSGFDKTGPYRATFLIESVSNLKKNLQERGSDLVVRIGKPENVLLELVKAVGADAVYMHREVSYEEVKAEERIEEVMKEEGVEVKYFWGSTLYHLEDLPFELEEMPSNYGGFKDKVKGLKVRKCVEAVSEMKGLPKRGNVEVGEVPSLVDLGLSPNATASIGGQNGKTAANANLVGGETEALERLKKFAAECRAKPNNGFKNGTNDSIYGANFSCKISPWLAMGCLSPRSMFDELKKSASSLVSAASNKNNGGSGTNDTGMNWLMYELLWRDFFRFITRKYSSKKQQSYAPVTACTGAYA